MRLRKGTRHDGERGREGEKVKERRLRWKTKLFRGYGSGLFGRADRPRLPSSVAPSRGSPFRGPTFVSLYGVASSAASPADISLTSIYFLYSYLCCGLRS